VAINFAWFSLRNSCDDWILRHSKPSGIADLFFNRLSKKLVSCYYISKAKSSINAFRSLNRAPDLVLLGSSLMVYPFWEADRALNIECGAVGYYHNSVFLERELARHDIRSLVFNWATLLQMVSDSYLIDYKFLDGAKKPKLIVLGLAPRDFFDNLIPSPSDTVYFQYFAGIDQWRRPYFFTDMLAFVQCALNKYCLLYCDRSALQSWFNQDFANLIVAAYHLKPQPVYIPPFYLARYKNITIDSLNPQQRFLEGLVSLNRKRNIKLVLINMPLSEANRSMLPPLFYDQFCGYLQAFAAQEKIPLVDLSHKNFVDSDYYDGVHLNRTGGRRLVNEILPVVQKELSK